VCPAGEDVIGPFLDDRKAFLKEAALATVVIRDKTIRVENGHVGSPDLRVTADFRAWVGFLRKERSLVWALLTRKIRLKGPPRLLVSFGKCFPS